MAYQVKELFYTLQGEGGQSGRGAVFLRFTGCNLWSGRDADRDTARCRFCDTDFVGGQRFDDARTLAQACADLWPKGAGRLAQPYVVCTGGEPGLQLDTPLIDALHGLGFEVAVESNGTIALPPGLDWVCISPKAGVPLVQDSGDELKLVWPQADMDPAQLEMLPFRHYFLQPMDGPDRQANLALCVGYCLTHPRWRLSLQTHKIIGIP